MPQEDGRVKHLAWGLAKCTQSFGYGVRIIPDMSHLFCSSVQAPKSVVKRLIVSFQLQQAAFSPTKEL